MLRKEHNDPRTRRVLQQHFSTIDGREVLWAISVAEWTFSVSKAEVKPGEHAYRATRLSWATILDSGKPGVGIRALDVDQPVLSIAAAAQGLRALFDDVSGRRWGLTRT